MPHIGQARRALHIWHAQSNTGVAGAVLLCLKALPELRLVLGTREAGWVQEGGKVGFCGGQELDRGGEEERNCVVGGLHAKVH